MLALSRMPVTSTAVTRRVIRAAGRLISDPVAMSLPSCGS
jgi:hypothetical protein